MKATSEILNGKLILLLEDVGDKKELVKEAYYQEDGKRFIKEFDMPCQNVEKIMDNFNKLAPLMFEKGEWEKALLAVCKICKENEIVWFLTGSACDAVRGIEITPHDLDIEIYSKHWDKAAEILIDYIIEPFVDVKGWAREHFGRMVTENIQIDLVADTRYDLPAYGYEPYEWNGYTLWLEPFMQRYETEKERGRKDRITAFNKFLAAKGISIE